MIQNHYHRPFFHITLIKYTDYNGFGGTNFVDN